MSNNRKLKSGPLRRISHTAGLHITKDQAGWIADGEPTLAALLTGPGKGGVLHDLCPDCVASLEDGGYIRRTGDGHFEVLRVDGLEEFCLAEDAAARN